MHVPMREHADRAGILSTRPAGARTRHSIERLLATNTLKPGHPVALDFKGVVAISVPFADECIGQLLSGRLAGYYEDHPILAVNASDDVRETIAATLRLRHLLLLGVNRGEAELLGADELLAETLRAAEDAGRFSASELARRLGVSSQ